MGKTKTTLEQNRYNVNGKLIAPSSPRMLACNNMTEINYFYWEKYIVDFRFHAYYIGLLLHATSIWVWTHWTDKICLTLPKISTKYVSAKFSNLKLLLLLCQWRLHLIRLQLVLEYHNRFVSRKQQRPHPYYWNLPRPSCNWQSRNTALFGGG